MHTPGRRAILSYLQVLGEQHRLVDRHVEKFNALNETDTLQAKPAGGAGSGALEDGMMVQRVALANSTGALDLKGLVPSGLPAAVQALPVRCGLLQRLPDSAGYV